MLKLKKLLLYSLREIYAARLQSKSQLNCWDSFDHFSPFCVYFMSTTFFSFTLNQPWYFLYLLSVLSPFFIHLLYHHSTFSPTQMSTFIFLFNCFTYLKRMEIFFHRQHFWKSFLPLILLMVELNLMLYGDKKACINVGWWEMNLKKKVSVLTKTLMGHWLFLWKWFCSKLTQIQFFCELT